jgi:hypothetical protein
MMDDLQDKVSKFGLEVESWSSGTHTELEALRGSVAEIEAHIRRQGDLLKQKQKEIADLERENAELKSVVSTVLHTSRGLMRSGPPSWIADISEKLSGLIDNVAEAEGETELTGGEHAAPVSRPAESSPATIAEVQLGGGQNKSPIGRSPAPYTASDVRVVEDAEPTDNQKIRLEAEPAARVSDSDKSRFDGLMDRVERLMSQN